MGQTVRSIFKIANQGTHIVARNSESVFPANAAVMRAVQALWPRKTDMHLAHHTGRSDRMCRYWMANKYSLSVDDLSALLRSEDGLRVLEAMMGDAKPLWWRDFKRSVKRAELRRQQKLIQKALDDDEQGELSI